MEYNTDLGTCVSLVNELCGYLETKRVFINCVPNAQCDQQQGVCKCSQGYVENGRHCIKQKAFGEACHSDNECLSELSLTCFEEVCQCDPKYYVPSTGNNLSTPPGTYTSKVATRCVTLAGLPCTVKTGCVTKASCVSETENDEGVPVSSFGWMYPGICKCDTGYEIDENRNCRGKFGSACDVLANVSCADKFQCLDGVCSCKYPDDQTFHNDSQLCVSIRGGPCMSSNSNEVSNDENVVVDEEEIICGKFMECKNSTCLCKVGFVENRDRGCDLSYGQSCTGETLNKCDQVAGLHCVDGACLCLDKRKEFNISAGKCVGKNGSPCEIPRLSCKSGTTQETDYRKLPCSENMKCQVHRTQLEGEISRGFCSPSKGGSRSDPGNSNKQIQGLTSQIHSEIVDRYLDY